MPLKHADMRLIHTTSLFCLHPCAGIPAEERPCPVRNRARSFSPVTLRNAVLQTFFLVLWEFCALQAQDPFEDVPETGDEALEAFIETLEQWADAPLDLNRAPFSRMRAFPFLSMDDAALIIGERSLNGPFLSWSDFIERMRWPRPKWVRLLPFCTFASKDPPRRLELRIRIQRPPAEKPRNAVSGFGAPYSYTARIKAKMKALSFGCMVQKDPYEPIIADHKAFFLQYAPWPSVQITAGQFGISTGLGITLQEPYGRTRGDDPFPVARMQAASVTGFSSSEENHYFSGTALSFGKSDFHLLLFFSRHVMDATPDSDGTVSGLPATGLHRTASERTHRKVLAEWTGGGHLSWDRKNLHFGITAWGCTYSHSIEPAAGARSYFAFRGKRAAVAGFEYAYRAGPLETAGEAAKSLKGFGWCHHIILQSRSAKAVSSIRYFSRDFQNPHGSLFQERSPDNQAGFSAGIEFVPSPRAHILFSWDAERRSWRSYFVPVPVSTHSALARIEYEVSPRFSICLRVKEKSAATYGEEGVLTIGRPLSLRMESCYIPDSRLHFRMRLEWVRASEEPVASFKKSPSEHGMMMYQDVRIRPASWLEAAIRWTAFSCDSYSSRVVQTEPDLPGLMTGTVLQGSGHRFMVLIKGSFHGFIASIKYGFQARILPSGSHTGLSPYESDSSYSFQIDARL